MVVKFLQSWQWRYQYDLIEVVLLSFSLTLNTFHLWLCSYKLILSDFTRKKERGFRGSKVLQFIFSQPKCFIWGALFYFIVI